MPQIFTEWQAAYAERGLPTFPINPIANNGKSKVPGVRNFTSFGLRASQQIAEQFTLKLRDTNGIACVAGAPRGKLRLAIIDVDARGAEADRLTADAMLTYGRSRFIVRTGGDGRHLYYRHNGEGRRIRPNPSCPIDVLGGGVVVLPPSLGAKQPYEIIEGHLDDLTALTTIKAAPTKPDVPVSPDVPRIDLTGMREHDGRNPVLFNAMLANGLLLPPTLEAFIDFAREQNTKCDQPMTDDEVIQTATSVFKYRMNGTLRPRQHGGVWFPPTAAPAQMIQDNLPLFGLIGWLKAMNGPDAEFWVADGMADILGWSLRMMWKTRQEAIDGGWIVQVARPAPGRPARYRWGPTAKAEPATGGRNGGGSVY